MVVKRGKAWALGALVAGAAWAPAGFASGAEPKEGSPAKVINFDDDTVQGDLTRPDGEYLESRGKSSHSNLIKVRESFSEKVLESVGRL